MHHSIEIDRLSFTYPDGHTALAGCFAAHPTCEKVALVGPNGAGKSTLILHLNGILRGKGGRCACAGCRLKSPTWEKSAPWWVLVFQSPEDQLFSPTYSTTWLSVHSTGAFSARSATTSRSSFGSGAYVRLRRPVITPPESGGEETDCHRHPCLHAA